MTNKTTDIPRIAFGVPEIARVTGIPARKLHYALGKGFPGATKIADRWALDTAEFFKAFPKTEPKAAA
jgi:hypothetical protein